MGQLVFQATLGGQVNLVGPNTASTFNINVPAVAGNMVTTGDTGTVSSTMLASSLSLTTPNINVATATTINGLTVGKGAGSVATNTAVGASALAANTVGQRTTAVGYQALTSSDENDNTGVGERAGYSNTTGYNNAFFGARAAYLNTTGSQNTFLGRQAGYSNTTASDNTAVGYQAGYSNTTGAYNTFFGFNAGYGNTTGTQNTYIGENAGAQMTTGSYNTIIGAYQGNAGGLDIRTSSNYIVLSDGAGNPAAYRKDNGEWRFGLGGTTGNSEGGLVLNGAAPASGNGAYINGLSNGTAAWVIGSYRAVVSGTATWFTCANSGGGGVYLNGASATSWTSVSDETRKVIIEPITDAAAKVSTLRAVIGRLKTDEEDVRRPYLIAQDVQAVLPEAVSEAEDKDGALLGLSYTEVIPLLVAAIKELKSEIDILKGQA